MLRGIHLPLLPLSVGEDQGVVLAAFRQQLVLYPELEVVQIQLFLPQRSFEASSPEGIFFDGFWLWLMFEFADALGRVVSVLLPVLLEIKLEIVVQFLSLALEDRLLLLLLHVGRVQRVELGGSRVGRIAGNFNNFRLLLGLLLVEREELLAVDPLPLACLSFFPLHDDLKLLTKILQILVVLLGLEFIQVLFRNDMLLVHLEPNPADVAHSPALPRPRLVVH